MRSPSILQSSSFLLFVSSLIFVGCSKDFRGTNSDGDLGGASGDGDTGGSTGDGDGDGDDVQVCQDDEVECSIDKSAVKSCVGGNWKTKTCASSTPTCLDGACVACQPDEESCRDNVAHRCSTTGKWVSLNSCLAEGVACEGCTVGAICTKNDECGEGACIDDACTACVPDERDCDLEVPRICGARGAWESQEACGEDTPVCSAGLCEADSCDGCRINGECLTDGDPNPNDECQVCSEIDPSDWSSAEDGSTCASGSGSCQNGICQCPDGWTGAACDICVVYVDLNATETGANTGTSWQSALRDLDAGLDRAENRLTATVDSCQVWVAEGTYKSAGNASVAFYLRPGVDVYGGFSGTEISLNERDWEAHETILSGDKLDNDEPHTPIEPLDSYDPDDPLFEQWGDLSDNKTHVVVGADGARLDGFTVTGGYAFEPSTVSVKTNNPYGGGMLNDGVSPTVAHLRFVRNFAVAAGGGMANLNGASPLILDSSFEENSTGQAAPGGGIYNDTDASPVIDGCSFSDNSAATSGGGIYNGPGTQALIQDSRFFDNVAEGTGGAIANENAADVTVIQTTFGGNRAGYTGGGVANSISRATFIDCLFVGNMVQTDNRGGAFASNDSEVSIVSSQFLDNYSLGQGGAIYVDYGSDLKLINILLAGNQADQGGAIYTQQDLSLDSCTLADNETQSSTSAAIHNANADVRIGNSIIWGNFGGSIFSSGTSPDIEYSIVEGGTAGDDQALHILDSDPNFVSGGQNPLTAILGDYHLSQGSPAQNTGDLYLLPFDTFDLDGDGTVGEHLPFDIDGKARTVDSIPDMGPYELQ